MGLGDTFNYYEYSSDDGSNYVVKLSDNVAAAGSFGAPVSPDGFAWGYGSKNLRHVTGITSLGKRGRLPIKSNSDSLYLSGGTFTIGAREYQCLGRIGERRPLSALA